MTLRKLSFEAIGTKWTIDSSAEISDDDWQAVQSEILETIRQFDKVYSRFRKDSWVSRLSRRAGTYKLPADAFPLLQFYEKLYNATDGLVTPLIGQVISDAGYDADYSLKSKQLKTPPAWEDTISYTEQEIVMKQPALLDFGAAGKGYLVDSIGTLTEGRGIHNFVINAGGDMLHRSAGAQAVTIGLENPFDTSEAVGSVAIINQSLCASAGSRRAWGGYNHMINPTTLESPSEVAATWVVAGDTMTADGLATALFFVKPERLGDAFTFEYAIMDKDMRLNYSRDLRIEPFEVAT